METESTYNPPKTIKTFFQQILHCFSQQNSAELAKKIRQFYQDSTYNTMKPQKWKVDISFDSISHDGLGASFANILRLMKQFQEVKAKKGCHYAFKIHINVLTDVMKMFEDLQNSSEYWICRPLREIVRASKRIFIEAEKMYHQSGSSGVTIKKDDLIYCLQRFKASRNIKQDMKKQILPLIDNLQVSIMLRYHNYDQIKRIVQPKKAYGQHGPNFEDNYYFQRGKTALINQSMVEAEQFLSKIKIKTRGQKRLVLKYLIPCKMFLGKMFEARPNIKQQCFPEYQPIISAIVQANFEQYNSAVQKYQKVWIKRGIYLLMDRLRKVVWRNLIKKVSKIEGAKINIAVIQKAVQISGGKEKNQQCICILSNLIYEGYIKGYIFQNEEARVLVLKKDGGFPKLSAIYQ